MGRRYRKRWAMLNLEQLKTSILNPVGSKDLMNENSLQTLHAKNE